MPLLHPTPPRAVMRLVAATIMVGAFQAAGAQEGEVGTGGIKGTIRDSSGQALIGVRVSIPGSSLLIESDDSGQFHLAKVRPGMLSCASGALGTSPTRSTCWSSPAGRCRSTSRWRASRSS